MYAKRTLLILTIFCISTMPWMGAVYANEKDKHIGLHPGIVIQAESILINGAVQPNPVKIIQGTQYTLQFTVQNSGQLPLTELLLTNTQPSGLSFTCSPSILQPGTISTCISSGIIDSTNPDIGQMYRDSGNATATYTDPSSNKQYTISAVSKIYEWWAVPPNRVEECPCSGQKGWDSALHYLTTSTASQTKCNRRPSESFIMIYSNKGPDYIIFTMDATSRTPMPACAYRTPNNQPNGIRVEAFPYQQRICASILSKACASIGQ